MSRNTILAFILIVVGVVVFISASGDTAEYADFSVASGQKVKVVGKLSKDKPMVYDAQKDANHFEFTMKDAKGVERVVVLGQPKPQDFELSEQIVVTGKNKGDQFIASEILLKCPSKYKNEEIAIKGQSM
jgi:cytochrome c-type biogenesis protein CcmE